jgi:hypothetical protein
VRERRHAVAVGKIHVGPCLDEQAHDLGGASSYRRRG